MPPRLQPILNFKRNHLLNNMAFSLLTALRTVSISGAIISMLFSASLAQAARPMMTDDARTVDAYACQVESWVRNNRGSREYWSLPACNFTGNLELTLGGAITNSAGVSDHSDMLIQGKSIFKPLASNGYGYGLAVGYVAHPAHYKDHDMVGDPYAYIPASFSFRDDQIVMHTNTGIIHNRDNSRNYGTWGLGSEIRLNPQNVLIVETFGDSISSPWLQVGLRHWVVPNRVQVDATYGTRSNGESPWISIGLRLLSVPFLQ